MSHTSEAQIRALIDAQLSALSSKNVDGVLSTYADDTVQFSLAPPLTSKWDARSLKSWFATWSSPIGLELKALTIAAADDVAFAHALNHMTGTKSDGEMVDLWFRLTLCFRKTGDSWKVVHEHESVPFYMDGSYRASTDLKP